MSVVTLQAARSTLPPALYLDMARLTARGLMRSRLAGIRLARTVPPIFPARTVTAPAVATAARMTWSRVAFRATAKLARAGTVRWPARNRAHRGASANWTPRCRPEPPGSPRRAGALSWTSGCARPPGCSGRDAAAHLCYTTAPALTWMSCPVICRLAELPSHPYPIGLRPVSSRWTER